MTARLAGLAHARAAGAQRSGLAAASDTSSGGPGSNGDDHLDQYLGADRPTWRAIPGLWPEDEIERCGAATDISEGRLVQAQAHFLTNWVDCVRSRQRPNAPAEAGVSATAAAHLGNRAFRTGDIAVWTTG
jgi:hypothetical protein